MAETTSVEEEKPILRGCICSPGAKQHCKGAGGQRFGDPGRDQVELLRTKRPNLSEEWLTVFSLNQRRSFSSISLSASPRFINVQRHALWSWLLQKWQCSWEAIQSQHIILPLQLYLQKSQPQKTSEARILSKTSCSIPSKSLPNEGLCNFRQWQRKIWQLTASLRCKRLSNLKGSRSRRMGVSAELSVAKEVEGARSQARQRLLKGSGLAFLL